MLNQPFQIILNIYIQDENSIFNSQSINQSITWGKLKNHTILRMCDLIIFRTKQKTLSKNLNFRIICQKLVPQELVKYLGIRIDYHLTFQHHLKTMKQNSHLLYGSQVWNQGDNALKIQILQNKALKIINFKD